MTVRHNRTRASLARNVVSCLLVLAAGTAASAASGGPSAQADEGLSAEARREFEAQWARQSRVDLGVPADGAAVVIVKFNDFQCPGCREAEMAYRPVLERFEATHPGAIRYVVKDWPWDADCNFNATATIPGHEAACEAAAAARMARDRGKYEEMVAWLYEHQGAPPALVRDAASTLLGIEDFDQEYARQLSGIQRDIADGGVLGINSTPTYFINGVRLPSGIVPVPYFALAVRLELEADAP